ncbi:MAG: alpha/beta hydrolase [Gammaproteobacteria bacterium]
MKVISPLLGLTLKTIYQPLELFAKYRELTFPPRQQNVTVHTNLSYGKRPEHVLDLYQPCTSQSSTSQQPAQTTPAAYPRVLYVHGGNFVAGDKCLANGICRHIASHGYEVYNINYRLAPKFPYPYQVQDIAQAIHWITQPDTAAIRRPSYTRSTEVQTPFFLMGDTSGANLVLTYATALSHPYLRNALGIQGHMRHNLLLKGLVLLYGAYDLEAGLFSNIPFIQYWYTLLLGDHTDGNENWLNLASPLRHVHHRLPPIFIAAGEADPLFSQSILLARRLKALQHPYATAFYDREKYPDGQHLFFTLQFKSCAQRLLDESVLFLCLQSQKKAHSTAEAQSQEITRESVTH